MVLKLLIFILLLLVLLLDFFGLLEGLIFLVLRCLFLLITFFDA